ncbi:hypothetical protein CR513_12621, partial [Mucuna pruriens]
MVAKVYGICTFVEHPTNLCPTLQETELDQPENVGAIVWKTTISARTKSRALCSLEIWIYTEYASRISRLPTTKSTIPSTTFPTATTTENTTSRKFSISRGPDEATCSQQFGVSTIYKLRQHEVPAKYECHHPRPQDVDRTVSQHYGPFIVGWIQQPSLTNNSESERECECSYVERWKRIISTSTIATEINRSRLRTGFQLTGAATRENYPIVVSNSNRLGKEIKL